MSIFAATCLHPEVTIRWGQVLCRLCGCYIEQPRLSPEQGGRACGCRADPIVFGHDCKREPAGG